MMYGMFPLSVSHTLFSGSWLFDYGVNIKGHDQGQALMFTSIPPPLKYNLRMGCKKIPIISETLVKRSISKSKILFALSKKVTPFYPFTESPLNEFWDEIFYGVMPLDDDCLCNSLTFQTLRLELRTITS